MRLHSYDVVGASALCLWPLVSVAGPTSFADTEFNLGHYLISAHPAPGDVTVFSQTPDGGNPGAALQDITTRTPATNGSRASNYVVNTTFLYNPTVSGAIESIDLSIQTFWQSSSGPLTNNGATFVISQDDSFYIYSVALPAQASTWLTASRSGLIAADFALVTDLRLRTTNPTRNPQFGGSPMQFGFVTGLTIAGNLPTFTRTGRVDNFSVELMTTPVPEPASWALLTSGALVLGAALRRRRGATH